MKYERSQEKNHEVLDNFDKQCQEPGNVLMQQVLDTVSSIRNLSADELSAAANHSNQTTLCLYHMSADNISTVQIAPKDLNKIVVGNENSEIVMWDFDLVDELQYYSTRAYKHLNRVPVRRVISKIDFNFADYNSLIDKAGPDSEVSLDKIEHSTRQIHNQVTPQVLRGHSKTVYEMSFVNNSSLLLSASGDKTIRAWDTNSTACLAVYEGHIHSIWTIDSNQSGSFVSSGRDGNALLWDVERTVPLRVYCGHDLDVNMVRFHPNCNYLATASADKMIILWDVNQVRQVRMFSGHRSAVSCIQFSSCGKYLASASHDGAVRLWDISQGKCVTELVHHRDMIRSLAFASNESAIASCGAHFSEVFIWNNPIKNLSRLVFESNILLIKHVCLITGLITIYLIHNSHN